VSLTLALVQHQAGHLKLRHDRSSDLQRLGYRQSRLLGESVKRIIRSLALVFAVLLGAISSTSTAGAATELLPDLRMRKLGNFYIQQASNGEKRLRFTTMIANAGPGRFELQGYRASTTAARMNIRQRIYNTAGTYRRIEIPQSSTYTFFAGDCHSHWHVHKLQRFEIRPLDANGKEGELKGTGAKTGFCFWDNTVYNLSLPSARQTPYYTSCGTSASLKVKMGISVGWSDKYSAGLAYQWIKINGLRDGNYKVRVIADPQNWFLESNNANNGTWTDIKISGNTVTVLRQPY
jgi:Lysyl oxidase